MTTNLPTISVTEEKDSSPESTSSDNEDSLGMDYNSNYGGVTDVEDFDSQLDSSSKPRSRRSSPYSLNSLNVPDKRSQTENDVTDVEDYNDDSDSEGDEEKSKVYPELKLSLQEFLQQGLQEQAAVGNEGEEKVEMKAGNFLLAQNLNALPDYLTDCEDYNTDSELEYDGEKSVCIDLDTALGGEQGQVCIADLARPLKEDGDDDDTDQYEDVSVISDISDLASALSDLTGAGIRGMSEDEVLEMSGDEEECHIAYSGSSSDREDISRAESFDSNLPEIDVAFIGPNGQQRKNSMRLSCPLGKQGNNNFLGISSKANEEVLTDVERIDDSAAEEDSFDNEEEDNAPIPRAIILASGEEGACQTDIEDMFYDDSSAPTNNGLDIQPVAIEALPPPHREVVELKEDKFGDTITNVMPMDDEYQFGIQITKDDALTDTEDYSCAEEYDKSCSAADLDDRLCSNNLFESEIIVENESLKPLQSKRLELHSNAESVTDVEEIYVAGTNSRRKKNKTRSSCKGAKPKYLEVTKPTGHEDGATDVEDMDLSDCGSTPSNKRSSEPKKANTNLNVSTDKITDIEDITADEVSDVHSEPDTPQVCGESLNVYTTISANIVITTETDAKKKPTKQQQQQQHKMKSTFKAQLLKDEVINHPLTDVEDVQLPSDAEDLKEDLPETSCNCSELNDMLNESYTVVHEKSVRNYDIEKLHIKGPEIRDAHTDVEYVESDEPAARDGN